MEAIGTDLIEVEDVPGVVVDENLGRDQRKEDDLSSKALTEKMVYLMQKISEYGYLTMGEVELIYANQTHAYRVLGTLRSKDLIGDFETEKQPKKAVYLKPRGYRTLEKFGKLRLKRRFLVQHFKPFIFEHRLACARVGLVLENHPLVREFLPESLLWERAVERRQKLCDGEFVYRAPDAKAERVGLEVELTLKNRDKLDEALRQLRDRQDLAQVWWVCGDGTILRALRSEVMRRGVNAQPRHLFCLMDEFMAAKHTTRLKDAEGAEFKIDPDEATLRPLPPKPEPAAPVPTPAERTPYELEWARLREKEAQRRMVEEWERQARALERELKRRRLLRLYVAAGVLAAALLAWGLRQAWIAVRGYFADPPPAVTTPTWRRRRLSLQGTYTEDWNVFPQAFYSKGHRYRFKVDFEMAGTLADTVCGATIFDQNGQPLQPFKNAKDLHVDRGTRITYTLDFDGPPQMKRFSIGLWSGYMACPESTRPEFAFEIK